MICKFYTTNAFSNFCLLWAVASWVDFWDMGLGKVFIQFASYHGYAMREVSVNSTSLYETN